MLVSDLVKALNLKVFSGNEGLNRTVDGGYVSDLLSDVMGFGESGNVWVTLQNHKNVMAIASLKDMAAVVLVKGIEPEDDTVAQSNEEQIPILGTDKSTFEIAGQIYGLIKK